MHYALENGMIDLAYVQEQIELNKRKELLEKHPYRIWEGKDGKWYTYFPDNDAKRVLRKRKTKQDLEKLVCNFWEKKAENPTIHEIFNMWIQKSWSIRKSRKAVLTDMKVILQDFL